MITEFEILFTEVVVRSSVVGIVVFDCDDVGCTIVVLRLIVVDVVSSVVFGSLVVFVDSVVASPTFPCLVDPCSKLHQTS